MQPRDQIAEIQKQLDRLTKLVERIGSAQKQEAKWRMVFRRQLNALVRRSALADPDLLADAKKRGWDLDITKGEDLEALAKEIMVQPPEVIERVKKMLGN